MILKIEQYNKWITTEKEERISKKILNEMCHNICSVGKSRTRWEDILQRDALQVLVIQRWRQARHTEEWACLSRKAGAQMGLQHHAWMIGYFPTHTFKACRGE
jgi:hypothetical protein